MRGVLKGILVAIIIIAAIWLTAEITSLWYELEPSWWEDLFGITRWDKLMETLKQAF